MILNQKRVENVEIPFTSNTLAHVNEIKMVVKQNDL